MTVGALGTVSGVLLLTALCPAQVVFDLPGDARAVMEFHFEQQEGEAEWDVLSARFLAYFQCGAHVEAQAAVDDMLAVDPSNPDALRFGLWLDSREPPLQARALEGSREWLRSFRDAGLPADRVAEVERLETALAAEVERRAGVQRAGFRSRWSPLGAVLLLALLLWHARRTVLRDP